MAGPGTRGRAGYAAAAFALCSLIAFVDALLGHRVILILGLTVGPVLAAFSQQARSTAIVGIWAVALAVGLGAPDDIWASVEHAAFVAAIAVVACVNAAAVAYGRWRTDVPTDDIVAGLYIHAFGRLPDAEGGRHYRARIDAGIPPADVAVELLRSEEAAERGLRSDAVVALREATWRMRRPADEPVVVMLHVMKTGGTAFTAAVRQSFAGRGLVLVNLYTDDLVVVPDFVWPSVRLVAGHLPVEAMQLVPGPVIGCTVLRDPVERVISHWWHVRADQAVRTEVGELTLDTFVHSPRWATLARDYQARQLAHRIDIAGAWSSYSPAQRFASLGPPFPPAHPRPLQSTFDCTPLGGSANFTERALENLAAIPVVGVTDDLQTPYRALMARMGMPADADVGRLNVSPTRPHRSDVPGWLVERIEALNAVDRSLFDQAQARSAALRSVHG